jgi:trk system potassium uptake protein TrkH
LPAYILLVYLSISAAAALSYAIGGMSWFDAITHAMTSAATGGFANYDASFGYFNDKPWLLWLASLWMTMAALPFVLFVGMAKGDKWAVLRDPQVKAFLAVVLAVTLMLTLYQIQHHDRPWLDALKHPLFNVVSVITTCGYASEDYSLWGCMAVVLFFYLTFSGGCSGSTSGGCLWFRC